MIDLTTETLLTKKDAEKAGLIPKGLSLATWWRWRTKGVRGRVLESVRIGGTVYTSAEAIQRFAEYRGGTTQQTPLRSPKQRQRAIERAERELEQAGI